MHFCGLPPFVLFFFLLLLMSEVGESSPTAMLPGLGVSVGGDTCMKNRSDLIYTYAWLHYLN
jgi:hypothetical protein